MKIAVIGGGINGVMTAWELCKNNHKVILFEKIPIAVHCSMALHKQECFKCLNQADMDILLQKAHRKK